jgi:hypothetical protein
MKRLECVTSKRGLAGVAVKQRCCYQKNGHAYARDLVFAFVVSLEEKSLYYSVSHPLST